MSHIFIVYLRHTWFKQKGRCALKDHSLQTIHKHMFVGDRQEVTVKPRIYSNNQQWAYMTLKMSKQWCNRRMTGNWKQGAARLTYPTWPHMRLRRDLVKVSWLRPIYKADPFLLASCHNRNNLDQWTYSEAQFELTRQYTYTSTMYGPRSCFCTLSISIKFFTIPMWTRTRSVEKSSRQFNRTRENVNLNLLCFD